MSTYEIRIKGRLDADWSDWFDGMTVAFSDERETVLRGTPRDQAALHGLLATVQDLGLTLIAVTPLDTAGTPDHDHTSTGEE